MTLTTVSTTVLYCDTSIIADCVVLCYSGVTGVFTGHVQPNSTASQELMSDDVTVEQCSVCWRGVGEV